MQISLDGVTVVLAEEHMDKLTSALAEKLLPKLEENWSRHLTEKLSDMAGHVVKLKDEFEDLTTTVGKLESDLQDLESRLDDSDSKMEDYISSSDLDVDDVNRAIEVMNNFDSDSVSELESRIDQLEENTSSKAIIERIARLLLESVSIAA